MVLSHKLSLQNIGFCNRFLAAVDLNAVSATSL